MDPLPNVNTDRGANLGLPPTGLDWGAHQLLGFIGLPNLWWRPHGSAEEGTNGGPKGHT